MSNRLAPETDPACVTLCMKLPQCCPCCGWPHEFSEFQVAEFEAFRAVFCVNGNHLLQKVTVEAALLAADAVGSDLRSWIKSDPQTGE